MRLTWLADRLRAAWPLVEEHPGWETRTLRSFIYYKPKGIINHHTAGSSILYNYPDPPYWPNDRLENSCNVTIKPNGVIAVLNSGWAYDSGQGAPEVLEAVKNDEPLPPLSGLTSSISGNAHFIDAEVQHRGDGGDIEPIQYEALIAFNTVVCREMGWDPRYRVIGHYEWAPDRKIDPYWDHQWKSTMPGIRTDTYLQLEETMRVREFVEGLAQGVAGDKAAGRPTRIERLVAAGIIGGGAPAVSYWDGKLNNPDDPEWQNFVNALEVETAINAKLASQVSGGGSLNVTLTGTARPA